MAINPRRDRYVYNPIISKFPKYFSHVWGFPLIFPSEILISSYIALTCCHPKLLVIPDAKRRNGHECLCLFNNVGGHIGRTLVVAGKAFEAEERRQTQKGHP